MFLFCRFYFYEKLRKEKKKSFIFAVLLLAPLILSGLFSARSVAHLLNRSITWLADRPWEPHVFLLFSVSFIYCLNALIRHALTLPIWLDCEHTIFTVKSSRDNKNEIFRWNSKQPIFNWFYVSLSCFFFLTKNNTMFPY